MQFLLVFIGLRNIITAAITTALAIFVHILMQAQHQSLQRDHNFDPCNQIYIAGTKTFLS